MLRTLLVPLDGSPQGEQALPHACRLARQTGAGLVLVRAAPYGHDPGRRPSTLRVTVRDAETYLQALQRQLMAVDLPVRIEVLHTDPVRAITFTALRQAVDLIVMSTHGYTGLHRLLLGSVAEAVVRHTPRPVFLVRASDQPQLPPVGPFRKVLVPLDGTPFAETALTYLLGMGCHPQEIVLLRALPSPASSVFEDLPPGIPASVDRDQLQETLSREAAEAESYLAQVARHSLAGYATRIETPVGSAGRAIGESAYGEGIECIAMATHARTGFDRVAHGSVATDVLRCAPVPVLLLHGVAVESAPASQEVVRTAADPADVSLVVSG